MAACTPPTVQPPAEPSPKRTRLDLPTTASEQPRPLPDTVPAALPVIIPGPGPAVVDEYAPPLYETRIEEYQAWCKDQNFPGPDYDTVTAGRAYHFLVYYVFTKKKRFRKMSNGLYPCHTDPLKIDIEGLPEIEKVQDSWSVSNIKTLEQLHAVGAHSSDRDRLLAKVLPAMWHAEHSLIYYKSYAAAVSLLFRRQNPNATSNPVEEGVETCMRLLARTLEIRSLCTPDYIGVTLPGVAQPDTIQEVQPRVRIDSIAKELDVESKLISGKFDETEKLFTAFQAQLTDVQQQIAELKRVAPAVTPPPMSKFTRALHDRRAKIARDQLLPSATESCATSLQNGGTPDPTTATTTSSTDVQPSIAERAERRRLAAASLEQALDRLGAYTY